MLKIFIAIAAVSGVALSPCSAVSVPCGSQDCPCEGIPVCSLRLRRFRTPSADATRTTSITSFPRTIAAGRNAGRHVQRRQQTGNVQENSRLQVQQEERLPLRLRRTQGRRYRLQRCWNRRLQMEESEREVCRGQACKGSSYHVR